MEMTLNVPFKAEYTGDERGFAYVADPVDGVSCYARSAGTAKNKLRPALEEKIREALDALRNQDRRMLWTKEGSMILVEWRYGGWGYRFVRPEGGGGSCSGQDSFNETLERARKHAEDAFGGIVAEGSL